MSSVIERRVQEALFFVLILLSGGLLARHLVPCALINCYKVALVRSVLSREGEGVYWTWQVFGVDQRLPAQANSVNEMWQNSLYEAMSSSHFLLTQSQIAAQHGLYKEAMGGYERAELLGGRTALSEWEMGVVHWHLGDRRAAISAWRQAPNVEILLMEVAAELNEMGKLQEASELLEAAIGVAPCNADSYRALFAVYCDEGDLDAIKALLRKASRQYESVPSCEIHSGWVPFLVEVGGSLCSDIYADELGLEALQAAATLAPDDHWRIIELGHCYRRLGQQEYAWNYYLRAAEMAPDSSYGLLYAGVAFGAMGDELVADEYYRKALVLFPANSEARIRLARSLEAQGELKEALDALADVPAEVTMPVESWILIGREQVRLGDLEGAAISYCQAKDLAPLGSEQLEVICQVGSLAPCWDELGCEP